MKTVVFLDLDSTLWEKQPWGGIISAYNAARLRAIKNDVRLVINTGRPQGQVETSLLRAGDQTSAAAWQDLPVKPSILPLSTFAAGIFEDGLIVKIRERETNDDHGFTTIFNSLDVATPEYRALCERLFDDDAKRFYNGRGIELITDGVVTEEKDGGFAVRSPVRGDRLRDLHTTLSPLYRQCNETTKLTYKPPLGPPMSAMKIDYDHPSWKAVESYLSTIEPTWRDEVGVDLPPDAIDMYPLKLEGQPSGERFRKAEANAMLLARWPETMNAVYVGDGYNDARAMQTLERDFPGRCLFVAPYKSDKRVIEFITKQHRKGVYAVHLDEGSRMYTLMTHVTRNMERHRML